MKKTKNNNFIKAAIAAVLSVALFSAAFVGINNLVFAAATNGTESIPATQASVNIPAAKVVPPTDYQAPELTVLAPDDEWPAADYQLPGLTVFVPDNDWYTPGANTISPEEAAEIGALYIWEVFGESVDGKAASMFYSASPSHTRPYWHGTVADSKEDLTERYNPLFAFTVCAISGERVHLTDSRNNPEISAEAVNAFNELRSEGLDINGAGGNGGQFNEFFKQATALPPEAIAEGAQAARAFAQKHFNGTEVVNVEYKNTSIGAFDLDDAGNIVVTQLNLNFTVTDETGCEADTVIAQGTNGLVYISTQHNDVVPGFNADKPDAKG